MNNTPYFSVVIPTFNCCEKLKVALESVFLQTFNKFEIIVIDNSSTDGTSRLLNNTVDKRLSVYKVQNEGSIAYSRNVGIKNSKGKWVSFLDSDDVWLPTKLSDVYTIINNNVDAILVTHNVWTVVNGERIKTLKCLPSTNNIYENLLFKNNTIYTSAVTLRKDIADKTFGFSESQDYISAEDIEYWLRLSQLGKFYFLDKTLGEWWYYPSNISNNTSIRANAYKHVRNYHLNMWIHNNSISKVKARICRGRILSGVSRIYLRGRMYPKAIEYVRSALFLYPFYWKSWAVLLFAILHFRLKKRPDHNI
jgi:teichuronic acid biosynthesis glycosyltransferase TuaG